jgi:hypothetical protein
MVVPSLAGGAVSEPKPSSPDYSSTMWFVKPEGILCAEPR